MSSKLVYSTGSDNRCPDCGKRLDKCLCKGPGTLPEGDGIVRISRESKGRGGKEVTIIRGLPLDTVALKKLAKQLKSRCGTGGSVKQNDIELQGDRREVVREHLQQAGYTVKLAGG